MTTRDAFLRACRADLNYEETPVNRTKFAAQAGHANGKAWCLTFLVAKARQTGLKLPNYGAYTPTLAEAFKSQGRYGRTPRLGAFGFVYYPWLDGGRIGHVFVVEALYSGGYTLGINGNSNSGGSRTGGMVCRVKRSPSYITYGYPLYTTTTATTTRPNPYAVPRLTSTRPYISRSTKKTDTETKFIQWAAGGPAYDDGVWGAKTDDLVGDFQERRGLRRDLHVGPKTLEAMKTVRR